MALSSAAKSARTPEKSPSSKGSPPLGKARNHKNCEQVLKFLKTVAKATVEPVGGEVLLKGVGCATGSALGGVLSTAHREIEALGMQFDEVAVRTRVGDAKLWKAGPKIQDAIEKLKEKK